MGSPTRLIDLGENHSVDQEKLHPIKNFLAVSDIMATAGQPTADQFALIAATGCQAVINLAVPDSADILDNEAHIVQSLNMHYTHIPVSWETPSLADVEKFFAALEKHQGQNIFVHCTANKRTAVFVFLYRVIKMQQPCTEVFPDVIKIWAPDARWTSFIEQALDHYKFGNH